MFVDQRQVKAYVITKKVWDLTLVACSQILDVHARVHAVQLLAFELNLTLQYLPI